MSDKEKQTPKTPETEAKEPILDFEHAKDLTVGQAVRKSEEIEAGVTDEDSVLDKYIKQHKEEILAGKFDTVHGDDPAPLASENPETPKISEMDLEPTSLDDFIKEIRSGGKEAGEEASKKEADNQETIVANLPTAAEVLATHEAAKAAAESPVEEVKDFDPIPVTEEVKDTQSPEPASKSEPSPVPVPPVDPEPVFTSDVEYQWDNEVPVYKRKSVIYSSLAVLAVLVIGGTAYWNMGRNSNTNTSSSSSSRQTSSSSSSSDASSTQVENLKKFNDLYGAFFTDDQQTVLKNSEFGNLDQLKTALAALEGTSDYDAAKSKYDSLVQQVSAVQAVNGQFESPAITDGIVDTRAQVKSDATFTDPQTSNDELNKVLSAAISQGRTQQQNAAAAATPAASPQQATSPAPTAPAASQAQSSAPATTSNGVNLQRNLSRVPYNQAAIDDVNNPAWTFNPGVLENILNISRQRGYFTGDQYILEKVNIINGNGYYNLFKSDGTYLFSINCKTGYFVGNAKGHSDALDF